METLVVDASALVDVTTNSTESGDTLARLLDNAQLLAPDHIYIESANALKSLSRVIAVHHIEQALHEVTRLRIETFRFEEYGALAWNLSENFSLYDAGYVAVAAITGAPLVTLDKKLAATARNYCDVVE